MLQHLGNGASACAIAGGRSVDTSMGLSPAEGLVMGTRSGDVDPALGGYLARVAHLSAQDYDTAVNRRSGLLGLAGVSDFRTITERVAAGDPDASLALMSPSTGCASTSVVTQPFRGRLDAVVFTGGTGSAARCCEQPSPSGSPCWACSMTPGERRRPLDERRVSSGRASPRYGWSPPTRGRDRPVRSWA